MTATSNLVVDCADSIAALERAIRALLPREDAERIICDPGKVTLELRQTQPPSFQTDPATERHYLHMYLSDGLSAAWLAHGRHPYNGPSGGAIRIDWALECARNAGWSEKHQGGSR